MMVHGYGVSFDSGKILKKKTGVVVAQIYGYMYCVLWHVVIQGETERFSSKKF